MHAMHFVAYAFDDISEVRIFYFGMNNIVAISKILICFFISLWNCQVCGDGCGDTSKFYLENFLFMICGYGMAPTCDLDTKNCSVLKTSNSESKISDIWPTL